MQNKIPCTFMRAGTSRGPFLDLRDLPKDVHERDRVLLKIMGSPDKRQIDGLGGAAFVTSKVVMVQPSERKGIDIDYFFAQVIMDKPIVDTKPTCWNMMTGVGPFAIEKGWVSPGMVETVLRIYNVNTGQVIEMFVQSPDGKVNYTHGDLAIDGVTGTASPVLMNILNPFGGATGRLFPTDKRKEVINEVEVSIVDAGNLMVLLKARDLGLSGEEGELFFVENVELMARIESIRLEAGLRSGLGDVRESVLPKVGLLSPPQVGGSIKSQYLTPHTLHPTHAVSGAICISTASKAADTVASDLAEVSTHPVERLVIEHPSGVMPIEIEVTGQGEDFTVLKAGTLRTARKIMDGFVYY